MFRLDSLTAKLVLFHLFVIALSNYLVTLPVTVLGFAMTWSAFSFPLIVVATDLTVRLLGKHQARKIIAFAYVPAILASIAVVYLTGAPSSVAIRIGVASGTAYLLSNLLDVYVFQKIRERYSAWWIAPFASSVVANIIDTFAFFAVAFYNSADTFMAENWFYIAGDQTVTKIIISAVVILPVYGVLLNYLSKRIGRNITAKMT